MTHTVFHEIAWLLLGLLGAALRQPVMVSFIAVGIVAGALLDPAQIRPATSDLSLSSASRVSCFWPGSRSTGACSGGLGPFALTTGLGRVAPTAGLRR